MNIRRFLLHVVLPLAVGCWIYWSYRSSGPGGALRAALGLEAVDSVAPGGLRGWVAGQLPDAAWAYAFTSAAWLIWDPGPRAARWSWALGAAFIASAYELLQLWALVPGEFSAADLVSSAVASGISLVVLAVVEPRVFARYARSRPPSEGDRQCESRS